MKIGIYDPYLDTLGGGEKYVFSIAECFSREHEVFIFWDDQGVKEKAKDRFSIDLSRVKLTNNIFSHKIFFLKRWSKTGEYDLIIYVSDGSIPLLFARKNIILFQFPVNWVNGTTFITRLKLIKINAIICYSNFVKNFLDKTFSINSIVLSPQVEAIKNSLPKENIILTVGRFTKDINAKKQEVLIDVFKKMCDGGLWGWQLVIVGSVLATDEDFVVSLTKQARGYPIRILKNISHLKLMDYYKKAKIYWHAAGFGEDLKRHPERAEHFGISTVEAMGAGAVPIVFNAGGQREIVKDGVNGLLWKTQKQLQDKTLWVINSYIDWQRLSKSAKVSSKSYSKRRFCNAINKLIKS